MHYGEKQNIIQTKQTIRAPSLSAVVTFCLLFSQQ
jgi:hypothetical protein